MSFTLHGIAVSSGIAIGHAHLVSHTSLEVAHYVLPKKFIDEEIARFDAALQTTRNELSVLRGNRPTGFTGPPTLFLGDRCAGSGGLQQADVREQPNVIARILRPAITIPIVVKLSCLSLDDVEAVLAMGLGIGEVVRTDCAERQAGMAQEVTGLPRKQVDKIDRDPPIATDLIRQPGKPLDVRRHRPGVDE